jgi:hypothetical protein
MTITISLQWLRIKQQEKLISLQEENIRDLSEKGFREVMGYGKVYRRRYKYIKIEDFGDFTLNNTAEKYHEEGYDLDRDKSTDRLLVFVKSEEVESKPSGENLTYKDKNQ